MQCKWQQVQAWTLMQKKRNNFHLLKNFDFIQLQNSTKIKIKLTWWYWLIYSFKLPLVMRGKIKQGFKLWHETPCKVIIFWWLNSFIFIALLMKLFTAFGSTLVSYLLCEKFAFNLRLLDHLFSWCHFSWHSAVKNIFHF